MGGASLGQVLAGKRFGLVLSAGFFGFFGHAGFWRALTEAGLVPDAYAGTSAGGLVASFAAAGASPNEVEQLLSGLDRDGFWDPDPLGALLHAVRGGHAATGLLKGEKFQKLLRLHLPALTFESCRKPLLLVATNVSDGESAVFTRGELVPAVHATCAYPGMFRAVDIDGKLFWDGGIVDKAPALALADSAAGRELDALLVHYLPSRPDGVVSGVAAYAKGLSAGMTALRRDHFRLQLEVLKARGVPVYVVQTQLPEVSPRALHKGPHALAAADEALARALREPAERFLYA